MRRATALDASEVIRCGRCEMTRVLITLLVVSMAAISLTCSESRLTDPKDQEMCDEVGAGAPWEGKMAERYDPDGLVKHYAASYARRRLLACNRALDDLFEFEFTPEVADSMGLPPEAPWWRKVHDIGATMRMFEDPSVTQIQMTLDPVGTAWEDCARWFVHPFADPPETVYVAGLCRTFEPDIRVYIDMGGGEPIALWVNATLLDIMVRPDPVEPGGWKIVRIMERHKPMASSRPLLAGATATEGTTWGEIKSLYR
jgi:hypothetical protein